MLTVRLATGRGIPDTLALPVGAAPDPAADGELGPDARVGELPPDARVGQLLRTACAAEPALREEVEAYLRDVEHRGAAGVLHALARPLRRPGRLLLVGVGEGDEAGWRAAGAAIARAARRNAAVTIGLPDGAAPAAVAGLAEGVWLAGYRYRLAADPPDTSPRLRTVTVAADSPQRYAGALATARVVAGATILARDLTNTPSDRKSPSWLAQRIQRGAARARLPGLTCSIRDTAQLAAEGFGGILAVGAGSARRPYLVELSWRPPGARTHVVLVGKGITFDTGGISIKPVDGMKLMRKDMGGAAAVAAATIAAATLGLPVRITALTPLAENMPSGAATRPGDVVRHFGGLTSEVRNTDAEGRLVLADALAYAAQHLQPDLLVDLATLTGAQGVALGKRTAALYGESEQLCAALAEAAGAAGEPVWRMPLVDGYLDALDSEVADLANVALSGDGGAGSVLAALYLREFTGPARAVWAHLDMSSSAWSDSNDGVLVKGATGWGVRTLVRWLDALARAGEPSPGESQPAGFSRA